MRCVIRPMEVFTGRERRMLARWVARLSRSAPDTEAPLEMRGDTLVAVADENLANDVAVAAMVVIGRPFFYEVISIGQQAASMPPLSAVERPEFGSPATR